MELKLTRADCRRLGIAISMCRRRNCQNWATHIDQLCEPHAREKYGDQLQSTGRRLPTTEEILLFNFDPYK